MNDPRTTLSRPIVATFHRKDQRRLVKGETRGASWNDMYTLTGYTDLDTSACDTSACDT